MGIFYQIRHRILVAFRIWKYRRLSTCDRISGKPVLFHPLLAKGEGTIAFGDKVQIGVIASPHFYSHYSYLEARNADSKITIGNKVSINNAFTAVAFTSITIKDAVLIGVHCTILDNDGHHLDRDKRETAPPVSAAVVVEENVFLGDNVTILKGVTIGKNSVVGACSVVTQDIPPNVVAAGNPARVIRNL